VPEAAVPVAGGAAAEPPARTASVDRLALDAADFRFLDPPEPGAHARVAITLANHDDVPSRRVLLGIPEAWFDSYSIIGTAPAVSQDRTDDTGLRTFSFPPIGPNATVTYELHVTAAVEGTTAPSLRVLLDSGETIGEATPSTQAPPPRPGPVMAIDIPRLKLHTGVIQTDWEVAPPYAVAQIRRTAHITEGNSVLIGHLTGAAGNIFAHLDQLQPGDPITATSRGVNYPFVVSRTFTRPNTDTSPIEPTDDARLTLMTCSGVWNPFTHDYSERLWVVAEPPDQAAETIAQAAATATAQATAAAQATATALALEPTPEPTPTPFVGEPSLPGGLGNTRADLGSALGTPLGETPGKLVVFRQAGREYHVLMTPDPPRAAMLVELPGTGARLTFEVAVQDARRLFPKDAQPRAAGPEGNAQFIVERFTSPTLEQAVGTADFSVIYTRGAGGAITSVIIGLGDDFAALIEQSRR
jgi:sortase (surface protein transpeptidase)